MSAKLMKFILLNRVGYTDTYVYTDTVQRHIRNRTQGSVEEVFVS